MTEPITEAEVTEWRRLYNACDDAGTIDVFDVNAKAYRVEACSALPRLLDERDRLRGLLREATLNCFRCDGTGLVGLAVKCPKCAESRKELGL